MAAISADAICPVRYGILAVGLATASPVPSAHDVQRGPQYLRHSFPAPLLGQCRAELGSLGAVPRGREGNLIGKCRYPYGPGRRQARDWPACDSVRSVSAAQWRESKGVRRLFPAERGPQMIEFLVERHGGNHFERAALRGLISIPPGLRATRRPAGSAIHSADQRQLFGGLAQSRATESQKRQPKCMPNALDGPLCSPRGCMFRQKCLWHGEPIASIRIPLFTDQEPELLSRELTDGHLPTRDRGARPPIYTC